MIFYNLKLNIVRLKPTYILVIFLCCFQISLSGCFTFIGLNKGKEAANRADSKRPSFEPSTIFFDTLTVGTILDVVKKDGLVYQGKYVKIVEAEVSSSNTVSALVLDIRESKKHRAIPLKEIDHLVIGPKSKQPKLVGGLIGAGVDAIVVFGGILLLKVLIETLFEGFSY